MIDSAKLRTQFPSLSRIHNKLPLTFLDAPAGTQVPASVIDAISNYYKNSNANTHGEFLTTNETDKIVMNMREAMASLLGAEGPETISIGQNMTTLNFALARGIARNLKPGDEVLITQLDHEGNRGPWLMLRDFGINVREVKLSPNGTLDEIDFEEKVNERTRLIAVGLASNALGTVNNVRLARELAYKAGAWLMLDAVAYAPHFKIDVQDLGCDFLLCSAYKFYGPHVGILYSRPGILDRVKTDRLRTALQNAPEKIETGTLNHAAIAGVTAAVNFIKSIGYEEIGKHERTLAIRLFDGIRKIQGVEVIGQDFASEHRAPTVSFTYKGYTPTEVCKHLAKQNIFAWDGHFYAIRAMEILGLLERGGVTRIGMAVYNTAEEIDKTIDVLKELK